MKPLIQFRFSALLLTSLCIFSGCAQFSESQSQVTDQEHWQELHDSLYDSFWVDDYGNPKPH
jgi:hypothetical protein